MSAIFLAGSNILPTCHFFQYNYNPPSGFCFDQMCDDPPIMVA